MSDDPAGSILRAVLAVEAADRPAQVQDAVRTAAAPFGFDRFVLFSTAGSAEPGVDRILWIEGDWFENGGAVDADTYVRRCPMTQHVLDARAPFFWSKTHTESGERYRVRRAPTGPGLHGLQVPVFGPNGLEGAMSLGGARIVSGAVSRVFLPVLAVAAFRAAERLLIQTDRHGGAALSEREREVLRWTAAGRRQIEIAETLGLSERTVENHLRRVRIKLGVATTAQAVRVAMRQGELEG